MSAEHLQQNAVENPRLNAEILLAHVLKVKRIDLYLNFERPLTRDELETFRNLLKRRLQHEPLQYITQKTEFMSLDFKVNRNVLVPRPETEILVETILSLAKPEIPLRILDIGTGSGNIAVSLAKNLPRAQITAIDISAPALTVAAENARLNHVASQISFQAADCVQFSPEQPFDIAVSNPPYISEAEFQELPPDVKLYEPTLALLAAENGLRFYRILGERAPMLLKTGGLLAVEIGFSQGEAVSRILKEYHFQNIKIISDLNQHDRIVLGNLAGSVNSR